MSQITPVPASTPSRSELWERYQKYYCTVPAVDLALDISRIDFPADFITGMAPKLDEAFQAMTALEKGEIVNPDEKRMVGHYWLRAPQLAPTAELRAEIEKNIKAIKTFAADVHRGAIIPTKASRFTHVLCIGIGGSALGPMFVSDALREPGKDVMTFHFIDNTDPEGMARVFRDLGSKLAETLVIVTSKSGGTPEPRNGMAHTMRVFKASGLDFQSQAVAITQVGSQLHKLAVSQSWLMRFPMWDWVGGRTSELSAVGLLPAALQGIDIDALLAGAASCDEATRQPDALKNPAALLALAWYHATGGKGQKDMVILPYKDRLLLFSRYLQQLVMESLGKRLDLNGECVDQGIAVYGNKGSTDQHAYVQQLRDGVNNFFVTFIRVLESGGDFVEVEPGITSGDYLHGFLLGTREALHENGRESITMTIKRVEAKSVGALIALFERAVGFYASFVGINAYHQPGVEAGKKAATIILAQQKKTLGTLSDAPQTAQEVAQRIQEPDAVETIYSLLEHLAANGRAIVAKREGPAGTLFTAKPKDD